MEDLAEAIDAVICDVALVDEKHGKTSEEVDSRKRFIAGASMGELQLANGRHLIETRSSRRLYCSAVYNVRRKHSSNTSSTTDFHSDNMHPCRCPRLQPQQVLETR